MTLSSEAQNVHGQYYLIMTVIEDENRVLSIEYHHLPTRDEALSKMGEGLGLDWFDEDEPYRRVIGTHLRLDEFDTSKVDTRWYDGKPAKHPERHRRKVLADIRKNMADADGFAAAYWSDGEGVSFRTDHQIDPAMRYEVVPKGDCIVDVEGDHRIFRWTDADETLPGRYSRRFSRESDAERFREGLEHPGRWKVLSTFEFKGSPTGEVLLGKSDRSGGEAGAVIDRWFGGSQ